MNPFELPGDDPLNYGLLQAGGALMAPGGGFGAAASALGKTVSNERQNQIDAQLKKLLIESRRNGLKLGIDQDDPSSIREWKYFEKLTPEQKKAYLDMKRQNMKLTNFGDVPTVVDLQSNATTPLSTPEAIGTSMRTTAQMKQEGQEVSKAAFDLMKGVDSQGRPMFGTRLQNLPFNPAMSAAGPPARKSGGEQIPDFPAGPEGQRQMKAWLATQAGPVPGMRPMEAGEAGLEAAKTGAKGTAEMYTEMSRAAVDAQEANRALDKISAMIEQGKVTGGPLAKPEVWARNALSEFGIPLNGALDNKNARLSAIASQRLAAKIMKGGRSLTDTDVKLIAQAFPGFDAGVPFDQLPAFIETVRSMNNDSIETWKRHSSRMTPEMRQSFPAFDDGPAKPNAANDLRKKHGLPPL
jgi:hypothetical protein